MIREPRASTHRESDRASEDPVLASGAAGLDQTERACLQSIVRRRRLDLDDAGRSSASAGQKRDLPYAR